MSSQNFNEATDKELQEFSELASKDMGLFQEALVKWRLRRKDELNIQLIDSITHLKGLEDVERSIIEARQDAKDKENSRERQVVLSEIRHASDIMAEGLKQGFFEDARQELEYKNFERITRLILTQKALELGLDLPTYLEVMKNMLTQGQDTELKSILDNIRAGIAVDEFQVHTEIDLLRDQLSGLYLRRVIIESMPESQRRDELLKDINDQIGAVRSDKNARERRVVDQNNREKTEGLSASSAPDKGTREKRAIE